MRKLEKLDPNTKSRGVFRFGDYRAKSFYRTFAYTSWYHTDSTGRLIYQSIVNKNSLKILLNNIRFDDANTREQCRELN